MAFKIMPPRKAKTMIYSNEKRDKTVYIMSAKKDLSPSIIRACLSLLSAVFCQLISVLFLWGTNLMLSLSIIFAVVGINKILASDVCSNSRRLSFCGLVSFIFCGKVCSAWALIFCQSSVELIAKSSILKCKFSCLQTSLHSTKQIWKKLFPQENPMRSM